MRHGRERVMRMQPVACQPNLTIRVVHEYHVVLVQHRQQDAFQFTLPQIAFAFR